MDFQLICVIAIVCAAALYVARAFWKALRGAGKGCGSGCGKCATVKEEEKAGRIALKQVK